MKLFTFTLIHLKLLADASVNVNNNSYNTGLPNVSASGGNGSVDVQTILQIVFAGIGAIALVVIIIAAINLVTSDGEPQQAAKARSTLIYAAIGLLVALSAEVIVTFVLNNI